MSTLWHARAGAAGAIAVRTGFVLLVAGLLLAAILPMTTAQAISFSAPTSYTIPPIVAEKGLQSVAVGDFNGDLDPDLAIAHEDADKISVLLGAAGGTFTGPTDFPLFSHANPLTVVIGNFNGDADPDLAVANEGSSGSTPPTPGNVSILLGAAGGTFTGPTNFPAGEKPQSVAVADYNGDADPDLAVANEGDPTPTPPIPGSVSILLGAAGSSFTAPTNYSAGDTPRAVTTADFNGDGDPDLAVTNEGSSDTSVLLGGAGASFGAATNYQACFAPHAMALGDFNGDSDPDMVVVNEGCNNVTVRLGAAGGTFGAPTSFAVGVFPDEATVGDLNGDGDPDLVVANQSSDNASVLLGAAGGGFAGPYNFLDGDAPTGTGIGEFNGDSRPDFAIISEASNTASIYLGVPDGYARPKSATPMTFRLVPAFNECTAPNSTHGAPLGSGSCDPSTESSPFLTFSAPDRPAPFNGAVAGSGTVTMKVFCSDGASPPCTTQSGDQEDVRIDSTVTGVRCTGASGGCTGAGATYAGKLLFTSTLRITDRLNTPVQEPATVNDAALQVGMQCTSGNCSISTTADAVYPGLVQELKRAVWQLSAIQLLDGGSDGNLVAAPAPSSGVCPPACAGNGGEAPLMRQGLLAP